MAVEGYQDDASLPSGGYWIIKNSWGTGGGDGTGYYDVPYGDLEIHGDIVAINTAVYYTGSMANATWKGGAGTWANAGTNWTNDADGTTYTWVNQETSSTFGGTGGAVTLTGPVIAHGLTINSTGYSFAGGSLTVTAGGITANQSATFNTQVYIGAPQSWTVAAGQTLTVSGALHTIVSDLTFNGAGNTTISGTIDGGGVLNILGGAKPGGLIQAGIGSVTLTGASSFGGDITVQSGSGGLTLAPTGGVAAIYSGAFFGGGALVVNTTGTLSLGGGASNFSGSIAVQSGGTLDFVPAAGVSGTFSGPISSSGPIVQNGPGTTILSYNNNYTGRTIISSGALQANIGAGIPAGSFLALDGGVLQNDGSSPASFTRSLGTSGATFEWTANGGGFSAGAAAMTVNIGGQATPITLSWGSAPGDVGTKIVGTLKFGSTSAAAATTFQNSIALGSVDGTIQVDDNPNSSSDIAEITGNISGSAGIVKTGAGVLKLSASNSYAGNDDHQRRRVAGGRRRRHRDSVEQLH